MKMKNSSTNNTSSRTTATTMMILHARADAQLVAELLTKLEINEPARLRFIAMLREMQEP